MGQKARRKGAKGASEGAHAMNTRAMPPLKQIDVNSDHNSNIMNNRTPSSDCCAKVRVFK